MAVVEAEGALGKAGAVVVQQSTLVAVAQEATAKETVAMEVDEAVRWAGGARAVDTGMVAAEC